MTINPAIFNTLGEPNRLNIVELLSKNPYTVNQIAEKLKLNQPQTSKHLKILADAGIVEVKPIKNKRIYNLSPKVFKDLDAWLEKYRNLWEDRLERLEKMLEKTKRDK